MGSFSEYYSQWNKKKNNVNNKTKSNSSFSNYYEEWKKKRQEKEKKQQVNQKVIAPTVSNVDKNVLEELKKNISTSPVKQNTSIQKQNKILKSLQTMPKIDTFAGPIMSTENLGTLTEVTKSDIDSQKRAEELNKSIKENDYGAVIGFALNGITEGMNKGTSGIANAGLMIGSSYLDILNKGTDIGYKLIDKFSQNKNKEKREKILNKIENIGNSFSSGKNKLLDIAENNNDRTSVYGKTLNKTDSKTLKTTGQVTSTVGEMIPSIVSNIAIPGSGIIASGISTGGNSAIETLNGDRSNLGQSIATGTAKGIVSAVVEKLVGGDFISKGGFDKYVAKGIKNKIGNKVTQNALYKGYQVLGENLEEQLENEVGYVIDKIINNKDMPNLQQRWEELSETAKITTLSTLTLNALGLGGGNINNVDLSSFNNKDKKSIKEIVTTIKDVKNNEGSINIGVDKNKIHTTSNSYISTSKSSNMDFINNNIVPIKKDVNTTKYSKNNVQKSDVNSLALKNKQLEIINNTNPTKDHYHTEIRTIEDIKTFKEAMQDNESFAYGDYSIEDAQRDLERGTITVYSSTPIKNGNFVSTSKNMAKDNAGNNQIYSKEISINDVAWINADEGQYAKVEILTPNNLANNEQTLYNTNESESGINENSRRIEQDDKRRIQGLFEQYKGRQRNGSSSSQELLSNQKRQSITESKIKQELINYAKKYPKTNLTQQENKLKNIIKNLNGNVVFYEFGDNNVLLGLSNKNEFYIDTLGDEKIENVFYHELTHFLRQNKNTIYMKEIQPIANKIASDFDYQEAIFNYANSKDDFFDVRQLNGTRQLELAEEIIADYNANIYGNYIVDYGVPISMKNEFKTSMDKILNINTKNNIAPLSRTEQKNIKTENNKVIAPVASVSTKEDSTILKYNKYKQNIIESKEKKVNNLISFKNETSRAIEQKIAEKETLLNSKKNQNTKVVSVIKSQIENLKARKASIENLYNEKIENTNARISKEKIDFETRNKMKSEAREIIRTEISPLTEDLTKYKDKKAGILFNREIAQRNIDDIVFDKNLAESIKETIFDPVQVHQANKTREINTIFEEINSLNLDKSKKYYYVPKGEIVGIKIDEATLSQLLIEKKITDKDLINYNINQKGIQKIHKTADTFTKILDTLYNKMNEEQIKYGYSPIGKIENYFPHFQENKADSMLGKISSYFGIDLSYQNLPTEIAGLTDTFKPGETWNSNIQKRKTNKTDYDALTAMEKYVLGATEIIHTTEDIQKVREYSKEIRYKYSDKSIQEEIDKVINDTSLTQEAKDYALEGIFKNVENGLPNFVTWLDDYANNLAGKKAFADRNMERNIGRNMYNSMKGIEGRIASNTIGGNISVSLTNFAPIFQAFGTTKPSYLLTGMLQKTKNNISSMFNLGKDTSFVDNSTFLTNRFGTDSISKKKISQKFSNKASFLMNAIDEFTAESIVRAKYLENLDKGITEEKSLDLADEYAGKIMADRSKGALPLLFSSKNPLSKLITMFQVEPNNMISNYFKDIPRDANSKTQLIKQYTNLMVASYAFNTIAMAIRGGNEVLPDPIRWVSYLIKMITGDDDDKEKAKSDLKESILGSLPFISNLAGIVGYEDIGRIPISNAMPNLTKIPSLFDKEADSQYKKETALKELSKPLIYLGLPTGGAQLKKTIEGITTVSKGGSYKTNKKGENQLQFAVENPNIIDYAQAGIFGKYSLNDSKIYSNRGYRALSGKQTKTYQESGIPFKEYTEYIDKKLEKKEDKINYIKNKKWSTEQKWGLYKNEILSDNERDDGGSQLSDANYMIKNGTSKLEYINSYNKAQENNIDIPTQEEYKKIKENGITLNTYINYNAKVKQTTIEKRKNFELKDTQSLKDKDKIKILINSSYFKKEKQGLYETCILSPNDKQYSIIKESEIDIDQYLKYKSQEFISDKKDDGTLDGKTITGSEKRKIWNFINNMNITYIQKLLLYGMEYTPSDLEQKQIVNYIDTLQKTQGEKMEILKQFKGFTIYKNGTFKY